MASKKTVAKTAKTPKTPKAKAPTAWDRVQLARDAKRPHLADFLREMASDFEELHGDRLVNDDRALIGGFATIGGEKVLVLGHHKGATVEENMEANFGMVNPDGYRKAMRLGRLAEKFHLPIVTFVDTPGAYPGDTAEARGQAEAIARSLEVFAGLKTPIVVVVTGEGGSGGALAIAVGDRILMLENAVYSVISPEGCAGILWRDGKAAPLAAEALKITAADLARLGVIDEIVPEPRGGAQTDHQAAAAYVKAAVLKALKELKKLSLDELMAARYEKLMKMGRFN